MYKKFLKRVLDIICSILLIVLLSPVFLIVWILIRIKLGKPVIFKQERPGKDEKVFKLYKFRTMTDERDEEGNLLPDEMRLSTFGQKLRSTSLDELPELFNILKGDMSFVGPRPLLVQYLELYDDKQKRRHEVRPGLTGLAQARGRNLLTWEERFNLDVEYVDKVSLWLDIKILIETVRVVIKREGIVPKDSEIMKPFGGNKKI